MFIKEMEQLKSFKMNLMSSLFLCMEKPITHSLKKKAIWIFLLKMELKDEEYLSILKEILPKLILEQEPDFIYYLCGLT